MDDYKKYNEALERIKRSHHIAMSMLCGGQPDEKTEVAIDEVEELVEKQKPVKPIDELNNEYDFHWYVCPICGSSVKDGDTGHKFNYCNECGRKMDWSEIND